MLHTKNVSVGKRGTLHGPPYSPRILSRKSVYTWIAHCVLIRQTFNSGKCGFLQLNKIIFLKDKSLFWPLLLNEIVVLERLTELSPFLGAEAFLGKRMSLERYSFSLCTFSCRDSVDLLRRRWSTAMPMVRATFLLIPAACGDSRQYDLHHGP